MEAKRPDKGFYKRPRLLDHIGSGWAEEEEARSAAETLVRRTRSRSIRRVEGQAPEPDSVRERREVLRRPDDKDH